METVIKKPAEVLVINNSAGFIFIVGNFVEGNVANCIVIKKNLKTITKKTICLSMY